jgi:hypothetical protein
LSTAEVQAWDASRSRLREWRSCHREALCRKELALLCIADLLSHPTGTALSERRSWGYLVRDAVEGEGAAVSTLAALTLVFLGPL